MASDVRLPQAKLWPRNDLWFWGVLAAAATLETPRSVRVALTVLHMTNFIFARRRWSASSVSCIVQSRVPPARAHVPRPLPNPL